MSVRTLFHLAFAKTLFHLFLLERCSISELTEQNIIYNPANSTLNCTSTNVVYCLLWSKENCQQIYIGQTKRQLKERFGEHKTSVQSKSRCTVSEHFNGPGHSLHNIQILALAKVLTPDSRILENEKAYGSTSWRQNIVV